MRKDKILDHDLMPLERIMVWTNRTKMFHVKHLGTSGFGSSQRRNKVSIGQAGLVRHRVDFGLAQDMGAPVRAAGQRFKRRAAQI
jgi:hypothetical protein